MRKRDWLEIGDILTEEREFKTGCDLKVIAVLGDDQNQVVAVEEINRRYGYITIPNSEIVSPLQWYKTSDILRKATLILKEKK